MLRPSRCTTQTASAPQPSTLRPFGSLRGFVNAETRIHADHSQVRDMLQKIAEAQGYPSINRLLEAWIRVHPTMIRREIRHSETGFKTGLFFKSNSKRWRARWDLNPGPPAPQADVIFQARLRALGMAADTSIQRALCCLFLLCIQGWLLLVLLLLSTAFISA